jgi:hypothetical protein
MHPPPAQIVTRQPTTASQPALALLAFLCRSILEADQDNKAGLDADDKRSANLFLSAQLHAIATVADVAKFVPLVDKIINAVTSESAEPTAKPKKKKS